MAQLDNTKLYLEQWVETATKGKVEIEWAWFVKRMMLACTVCKQTLTAPIPERSDETDYSVQEFVKIHAHTGGHSSGCPCASCKSTTAFPKKWTEDWTAVIAGFKKLNPDKDAEKIATQLKKFKTEYDPKKDKENIAWIKALQSEKLTDTQKGILSDLKNKNEINKQILKAQVEYALEQEQDKVANQTAKNILNLKNFQEFQAMLDSPIGQEILKSIPKSIPIPAVEPKAPEAKKTPIKKDIQGRKFR